MTENTFSKFDTQRVPSPCFVVDRACIEANLQILKHVADQSGARVLSALKAFSMWNLAPLVSQYLDGTCASGVHEARLGREHYKGEVHVFSAAYSAADLDELLPIADHLVFNSFGQWKRFRESVFTEQARRPSLKAGLRINPEHSEGTTPIYDPCAPGSRLGITRAQFEVDELQGISGLHFHTLCEQDVPPLKRTLEAVEAGFADVLPHMQWVNFGGGHLVTEPGYQVEELIQLIKDFAARYDVQVYLEPGEAVAIHSGVLVSEILDIIPTDYQQTILDISATCHMPDTLEMPYRPHVLNSAEKGEQAHTYRLGGMTCLAGDVIGDYSFREPLHIGDRLVFDDMAHYTMVKTSTFNGIPLPSLAVWDSRTDELQIVRQFGYEDFKNRLS
ncbi:carboxynorspermidine decarboxylase [Granulosicoccus antarcticus]|uniref:Carboxynorspermidine/carboxyspermidine decarboxylase n=1 Tax=Granulosicoccus antarcticus IMCC3135 TaxID=1192854 RepID=A0A2Z2P008_9GAMM|nr:carboxynorspermidine decarboxylase [Granulosicoccus antarcticus]ASJ72714.1 Carboxynorspermidine/carboxyspermidine decarboxylase [Granulosicoccus antarcticus IMCC3135]